MSITLNVSGSRQLVLPALLLAATFCPAAISFQQRNSAVPQSPQSVVSVTFADAQAAGDTNIVAVGWSDVTSSVTAVTDTAGNVYALAIGPTRQSGAQSQSIYVAKNVRAAAANSNAVIVTFNTAAKYPDVRILSYRGLDPASPVEAAVGAGGSGTTSSSGSLTTVNTNDLLFAANCVSSLTTQAGSGFTSRVVTSPDGDIAQDLIVTSPGTYRATASMSSGNWVMQLVALKAAGSQPAAAMPTFSPGPGTYTATQSVSLQVATPGATIYYTTDGVTNPTTSSVPYYGEFADPGQRQHDYQGDGDGQRLHRQRSGDWCLHHPATIRGGSDLHSAAGKLHRNAVGDAAGYDGRSDDLLHHGWRDQPNHVLGAI